MTKEVLDDLQALYYKLLQEKQALEDRVKQLTNEKNDERRQINELTKDYECSREHVMHWKTKFNDLSVLYDRAQKRIAQWESETKQAVADPNNDMALKIENRVLRECLNLLTRKT